MSNKPSRDLQTFPNPNPDRPYHVHIEVPEFTCLCPLTGQPDFATLVIDYLPNQKNVELKSLKMYMWSYREEGAFHEAVTNKILDDLVAATDPRYMKLTAKWYVRGGVYTTVVAEHRHSGFQPLPKVELDSISTMNPTRG
ncbi:MAG: preQ(1) synthase [Limnobacter sp.]|jgi:7-cyano-7-deazaguanine reductase|uniref:NADPH-dependent 7-cyano-7-deazaguanine reductase n=1 Tax=Limnobacter profundi TaxID=2732163 RepID=A0ABX6N5H0_9BURK|nr:MULTISPECIES: preQ(1) synthase [unclassified Limnobacter]MAG81059.1 NADPH-dependent 7-cyano-7-deazaguanine reductase QueF [Sutterellaceae bacterium]MBA4314550.1 NADPH-dependent 7-cyano-7-deazaguanine reductase QueF [Alcaligenaceae bacterium]MBU0541513.1 preQ(1) synthase [Gammaproteobacteria bacterium]PZO19148.1 MAG: NADPH-dependent 7-cyano-7-deazaguanine reductase QueF [Betaproteobacteria bacterium]MBT83997.1 NADPH-dependent 7-cyano-7-deazaguanine reductase QueF [Sutterellaceae bacterium]|tara:strand:+ start:664 stop:1083 length:420 start_codon:yes stop_codon:yes gene_type:complete